jgi:hypothetical protein
MVYNKWINRLLALVFLGFVIILFFFGIVECIFVKSDGSLNFIGAGKNIWLYVFFLVYIWLSQLGLAYTFYNVHKKSGENGIKARIDSSISSLQKSSETNSSWEEIP